MEQTTHTLATGKAAVPIATSCRQCLQQTTQDLGTRRTRMEKTLGEQKENVKPSGKYPLATSNIIEILDVP